jgi:membrane protease YdiL (CAAX protease family)
VVSPEAAEPIPMARPVESEPDLVLGLGPEFGRGEALVEAGFVLFVLFTPTIFRSLLAGTDALVQAEKLGISPYWSVLLNGVLATAVVAFILHKDRHSFKSLGVSFKGFWKEALIAGGVLVGLLVLLLLFSKGIELFSPDQGAKLGRQRMEMIGKFPYLSPGPLLLFTLFVGFYEELLFRGFLITRMTRAFKCPWAAVLVSSAIFAAIHSYQDGLAMVQIFCVALILGGLFVLRGSLLAPILVHTGFNFANLTLAFVISRLSPEKLKELLPKLHGLY